jgi:hypothetical protein
MSKESSVAGLRVRARSPTVDRRNAPVRLATAFLIYLQVLVLALTSPISAGRGPHRDQLLDPVIPHVHPDVPSPGPPTTTDPPHARLDVPALGAGANFETAAYGEVLVPLASIRPFVRLPHHRLIPTSDRLPVVRQEPPPDPPPLAAG